MDGVSIRDIDVIAGDKGSVMHVLRNFDEGFVSFGEVYISTVLKGAVKGWKKHSDMTLNLVVPVGSVKFVIYDPNSDKFLETVVGATRYKRLTIKPGLYVAFTGLEETNYVINVADLCHDPAECVERDLDYFAYEW